MSNTRLVLGCHIGQGLLITTPDGTELIIKLLSKDLGTIKVAIESPRDYIIERLNYAGERVHGHFSV